MLTGRSTAPVDCVWRRLEHSRKGIHSRTSFGNDLCSHVGVGVAHFAGQTIPLGSDLVVAVSNLLSTPASSAHDAISADKLRSKLRMSPEYQGETTFAHSVVN